MKIQAIINILLIPLLYVVTRSLSATLMGAFIMVVGVGMCFSVNNSNRKYAFGIYNLVFLVTTIIIVLRFVYLTDMQDNFLVSKMGIDEQWFYLKVEDSTRYPDIANIFYRTFNEDFLENQGFMFYIRSIGYLSTRYFDGNHIVTLLLGSGLMGCVLSVILFKINLLFFRPKRAYIQALVTFLLSPFLFYSVLFLRDIHMALVYAIIIYIVLKPFHYKGLLWLGLLSVLAFYIRMEHGLFVFVFITFYLYKAHKLNDNFIVLIGVMVAIFIANTMFFSDMYNVVSGTNTFYLERSSEMSSAAVESLPHPFREIGIFIMGNFISPTAYWTSLFKADGFFSVLQAILRISYSAFWLYLHFMILKWVIFDKKWSTLSVAMRMLLIIALFFELANSTQMETRRVMCIYPIFMVLFFMLRGYVSKKTYKQDLFLVSTYYLALSSLIIIFKG